MPRCPTCAETYPPGTRFCRLDGTLLVEDVPGGEAARVCPACATTYPAGTAFCRLDGARLVDAGAAPAADTPPAGDLLCPACGATYAPGVNFCRLDGTPLAPPAAPVARPRVQPLTVRSLDPTPPNAPPERDPRRWAPPHTEPPPAAGPARAASPAETALDALALLLGTTSPSPPAEAPSAPEGPERDPVTPDPDEPFVDGSTEAPPDAPETLAGAPPEPETGEPGGALEETIRPDETDRAQDALTAPAEAPADEVPDQPALSPLDPSVAEPSPFDPSPYAPPQSFDQPFIPEAPPETLPDGYEAPRRRPVSPIALIIGLVLVAVAIALLVS